MHLETNPLENVLSALRRAGMDPLPAGPDGWHSRCPSHQGRRRNLSIRRADDGRVLLYCHHVDDAGRACSLPEILGPLNLAPADLFPPRADGRPHPSPVSPVSPVSTVSTVPDALSTMSTVSTVSDALSTVSTVSTVPEILSTVPTVSTVPGMGPPPVGFEPRGDPRRAVRGMIRAWGLPTGEWIYHDEQGVPVLIVFRFDGPDGKSYRPVHPAQLDDAKRAKSSPGLWLPGDPPGPLPLYRLTEVLAVRKVYVVEGEKAADALANLGLVVTTSSHGASAAPKTDWSPLAGSEVIIMPDADRAGEGYLKSVLGLLAAVDPPPSTVRVVRLDAVWNGSGPVPDGADAADWLDVGVPDGWTDEDCRNRLEAAATAAPEALCEAVPDHGAVLTCLADVEPRPIQWLWHGWLPTREIITLAGDPGLGKSFLTIDLAARVSRGLPWPDDANVPAPWAR